MLFVRAEMNSTYVFSFVSWLCIYMFFFRAVTGDIWVSLCTVSSKYDLRNVTVVVIFPLQRQIPVLRLHDAGSLRWQQGGEGLGEGHHDAEGGRGGVLVQPTSTALPLPRLSWRDLLREIWVLQGEAVFIMWYNLPLDIIVFPSPLFSLLHYEEKGYIALQFLHNFWH